MVAVMVERRAWLVEGAEQQRGVRQVDLLVLPRADIAERAFDRGCGHQDSARRRGSSFMSTWLTTCLTFSMLRACSITSASSSSLRAIPMR